MQRIAPLVICLGVVGCGQKTPEGGLLAVVNIDTGAFVTCVEVSVLDADAGTVLASTRVVRSDTRTQLKIGIGQFPPDGGAALPATVNIQALGLYDSAGDCSAAALRNDSPSIQPGTFSTDVPTVTLTLHRPDPGDDADDDGFVAASQGGPDCDDTKSSTNPAAAESCDMLVDLNCNGLYGCQDPTCMGQTCIEPPAQLEFSSAPQSTLAATCSGAIIVETRDAMGALAPVSAATAVTLIELTSLGLTFYSDSDCTVPSPSLTIAKGENQARFFARGSVAGSTQLQASSPMLTSAAQAFVVTAGAPVALAFKTAPQTVKAFACSGAVTLEVTDQQGNATPVTMQTAFTLTATPSTNVALFTDATCMTPLGTTQLASGTSSSTVFFKASIAPNTVSLAATAAPLTPPTAQVETIVAGDPVAIVIGTASQSVTAGACSTPLTVKVQDMLGTDTVTTAATTVMLSGATFTFFSGATCAANTAITTTTIPAGMGSSTIYFSATLAGTPTVTAMGGGLANANQTETVVPGPPTRLAFKSSAQGLAQSTCSSNVTLESRDAFGNPSSITGTPLLIGLTASPSAGFTFYDGGGCGDPVTSVSIAIGSSTTTFNFQDTAAGVVTMTADSSLAPDPTQVANIGVGPPSQLVFVTAPQTKTVNICSAAVTLETHDTGGNVANVTSPLPINLAATPGSGFSFYSDPGCTTAVAQVSVPVGGTQASFYFKGTVAGTIAMAPTSSLTNPTAQNATLVAAAASAVVFSSSARSITAGSCSGALMLQSRDAFGNPSNVAADVVLALTGAPASGLSFYGDAACATSPVTSTTILSGMQTATFYASATLVPAYTLTAASAALGMTSQTLTVNAATASKLVITTTASARLTGQCSAAVTVQRRDGNDNATTAGALTVTATQSVNGGLTFYTDGSCGTATSTFNIANGASSVDVFFRGVTPGMPTLTASATSLTSASQQQLINVSPASVLAITTGAQLGLLAGACSGVVTLETRDGLGNASPVAADTPISFGAAPVNAAFYSDSGCTNAITGTTVSSGTTTASWYFKGTTALTFTLSANATGFTAATQGEGIVPAGLSQLAFVPPAHNQGAGVCSTALIVQRADMYGNPVTAGTTTVNLLAAPATGFTFYSAASCGAATAITSFNIGPGASAGTFYVEGTVPGGVMMTASATGAGSATQTETINTVLPSHIVFTTPARGVQAGACSAAPLTIEAQDAFNNPAAVSGPTLVSLMGSGGNLTFYSDAACTAGVTSVSIPNGMTDVSFYATGTLATGPAPGITASAGALGIVSQGFTVTAAAPAKLIITSGVLNVGVGGCAGPVAVQTQDSSGNVSNVTTATTVSPTVSPLGDLTFFSDATCVTPLGAGAVINTGQSAAGFYIKGGSTPGTVTLSVASSPVLTPASQLETIGAGTPSKLAFSTTAPNLMAGECSGAVTVQLEDSGGNPTSGSSATTVNLSASPSTGFVFYSDPACTMAVTSQIIASGTPSTTFYVSGVTGGSITMTAADAAGMLTSATQAVTVLNGVMTGTCTIANGNSTATCAITPSLRDVTKTFLMFQATTTSAGPASSQVRCELTDTATITCTRGGTTGAVGIWWNTVARPAGLTVQHLRGITASGMSQVVAITAVSSLTDTFLLMSTDYAGTTYSGQQTRMVLTNATTVTLDRLVAPAVGAAEHHYVQVVEWTGATVVRNVTSIPDATASVTATVADSTTTPTLMLSTWKWNSAPAVSNDEACRIFIHPAITNSTTLTFSRANGTMPLTNPCYAKGIDVAFERVSLPAGNIVDSFTVNPGANTDGATQALGNGPFDLTRSFAFFSGQGIAGQSGGECADTTADLPFSCASRVIFSDANTLDYRRASSTGVHSGSFALFGVQLSP